MRNADPIWNITQGVNARLILERPAENGASFIDFGKSARDTLTKRFGCRSASDYGYSEHFDFMIDITESNFDNDSFRSLLGYINTAESEQRKSIYGSIK